MKKILLLGIVFGSFQVNAQNKAITRVPFDNLKPNLKTLVKPGSNSKKTRSNSRWYDPLMASLYMINNDTTGLDANTYSTFLWKDSTMLVRYSTSGGGSYLGGIYLKSMAQILDPFSIKFNNNPSANYNGQMALTKADVYKVDSVAVAGFYRRIASKPNIVDSLIIHVGYGNLSGGTSAIGANYNINASNSTFIIGCYAVDTMRIGALDYNFNSMGLAGTNVVRKAIPLTVADSGGNYFATDVNLAVPAGNLVAMSIDFKSGDTWIPNVDTVGNFNFFRAYATEENASSIQSYYKGDFNSNHSLDNDTTGWGNSYVPNYFYIGDGSSGCQAGFDREQYWTLWKLSSTSSNLNVGIKNVNIDYSVKAYPNPANDVLNFDLNISQNNSNGSINIYSLDGQIVKTLNLNNISKNGSVKLDISSLNKGMYICEIQIEGKKMTSKFIKE